MNNKKTITSDLIYCISALLLMNCVLQLIVYPRLNAGLGSEAFGNIVYLLGIISIFAPALGLAVNNTRLVKRNEYEVKNGDANIILACFCLISAIVSGVLVFKYIKTVSGLLIWILVISFTLIRYYADVQYRLTVNYKKYFIFYLILSVFYLVGLGLFRLTKNWLSVFLIGELSVFIFVVLTGTIFKNPFEKSKNLSSFSKAATVLAFSYLIYNFILNADRIILLHYIDSVAVSHYYVVSLIGKTVAILVASLNSLIIGYLTKSGEKITAKAFTKGVLLVTGISIIFFIGSVIATPIFIKLFYTDMYESVKSLIVIVSLSQILCFASSILLTIVLTVAKSGWQLLTQSIYGIVFLLLGCIAAENGGIFWFSIAALFANGFRFVFVIILGMIKSRRNVA